jgi:hypothetical protein
MKLSELTALVAPRKKRNEVVQLDGGSDGWRSPGFTVWRVRIQKVIGGAMVLIDAGPAMEPEHAIAVAAERFRIAMGAE